jgi:hypothetical protein
MKMPPDPSISAVTVILTDAIAWESTGGTFIFQGVWIERGKKIIHETMMASTKPQILFATEPAYFEWPFFMNFWVSASYWRIFDWSSWLLLFAAHTLITTAWQMMV